MLKTVSSITNAIGALNYKGTWNASTNSPALASGVGTKGDYYVVSVAGSTTLDGISNWGVGDWAVYNGAAWQRVEGGADLNGVNLTFTGTASGPTYETSNLTTGATLTNNSLSADGTDTNIDLLANPKGTGGFGINGAPAGVVAGAAFSSKFCVKNEDSSAIGGFVQANNTTASSGSGIFACRSRGTLAAPTVVQSGDNLASLFFLGNDGTDLAIAAVMQVDVDGTPGDNDMPGRIVFKTTPDGSQIPAEAMRIHSSGGVSIGNTTDPGATNLSVTGTINKMTITPPATSSTLAVADGKTLTASNTLTLAGTDSTTMTFPTTTATIARTDAAQTFTGTQTFGEMILGTNAAKIFASGGVSIGNTTNPGATNLSVTGTASSATVGSNLALLTDNFALGYSASIVIGPASITDTVRLNLHSNVSGGSNIALQGNQGGGGVASNPKVYFGDNGYAYAYVGGAFSTGGSGSGGDIVFGTTSNVSTTAITERMRISSAGIVTMSAYGAGAATFSAAGVISSVSDETWKIKDGVPLNPDAMLQKLEPGYWFYNEEKAPTFGTDRQLGFYAQNVNEAIGVEAAPVPEEGKPWGYYDRSVLAVTVMSLQKALATIESLTARLEVLEAK